MHRWIGRIVIIYSVLYGAIAILSDGQPVQVIRQHYILYLVSYQHLFLEHSVRNSPNTDYPSNQEQVAYAIILVLSVTLYTVIRRHPQLAMKVYYLLGSARLTAIAYYIQTRQLKCLQCLVAAATLQIILSLVSLAIPLGRRWGHSWPSIIIFPYYKLLSIDIIVPSSWKVEPGQYMYLQLLQAGLRIAS